MALLSGFPVSISEVRLMGEASRTAFSGPVPVGWSVVTPAALGLSAVYQDGNFFTGNGNGASAIVLTNGTDYIVAFRGTDGADDIARYMELFTGKYINHFAPLLSALAGQVPADAEFFFTGASLGGGATNLMAKIAGSAYGGRYADAKFVAFASPNIVTNNGILNIGFDNDPVYKAVNLYKDYSSSLDNLILATSQYMAGNTTGRKPFDMYAHTSALGFDAFNRLEDSVYLGAMKPDSVVIFDANNGLVTDKGSGRSRTGAFYLGEEVGDQITGRGGNDYIEGFGGADQLKGGKGNDNVCGGQGSDTIWGEDGNDTLLGDAGNDTIYGGKGDDIANGGTGSDTIHGDDGNDTLRGNADADFIFGGKGNDKLFGDEGADRLDGGDGKDEMTGGDGADTFVIAKTGSSNVDKIFDYDFAEGDVIDLSALLDASFGPTSVASDFVRLVASGSDFQLQIDANGTSGGARFATVATLTGYATPDVDQVLVYFEQQTHVLQA